MYIEILSYYIFKVGYNLLIYVNILFHNHIQYFLFYKKWPGNYIPWSLHTSVITILFVTTPFMAITVCFIENWLYFCQASTRKKKQFILTGWGDLNAEIIVKFVRYFCNFFGATKHFLQQKCCNYFYITNIRFLSHTSSQAILSPMHYVCVCNHHNTSQK